MTPRLQFNPVPASSRGGNDGKPPITVAVEFFNEEDGEKRRSWLTWLRKLLLELIGSEAELELCLAIATGEITFVELGNRLGVDRRTAKRWWLELLSRLRQRGLARLSAAHDQDDDRNALAA